MSTTTRDRITDRIFEPLNRLATRVFGRERLERLDRLTDRVLNPLLGLPPADLRVRPTTPTPQPRPDTLPNQLEQPTVFSTLLRSLDGYAAYVAMCFESNQAYFDASQKLQSGADSLTHLERQAAENIMGAHLRLAAAFPEQIATLNQTIFTAAETDAGVSALIRLRELARKDLATMAAEKGCSLPPESDDVGGRLHTIVASLGPQAIRPTIIALATDPNRITQLRSFMPIETSPHPTI